MITDVRRQVTGLRTTDDTRTNNNHIYFILTYCASKLQYERYKDEMAVYGLRSQLSPDPSLYQEYTVAIDQNGVAQIPVAPIRFPMDNETGLYATYLYDKTLRHYRLVRSVNQRQASISRGVLFEGPKVVRTGTKLQFINCGTASEAIVVMNAFDVPVDEDGTPKLDALFPISESLVADCVNMAVKILLGALSIPADYVNDNKA